MTRAYSRSTDDPNRARPYVRDRVGRRVLTDASQITVEKVVRTPFVTLLEGSDSGSGVTKLNLTAGAACLLTEIGVPVGVQMVAEGVSVSWTAATDPGGDWTATLDRRKAGEEAWSSVATLDFETS